MNKNKLIYVLLIIVGYSLARASGAETGSGDESAIPVKTIFTQAVNLGLLLIVLFLATKKTIVEMFKARLVNYKDQAEKTEKAALQAEAALADVKNRIDGLKKSENLSLENAKKESESLKNKFIEEARLQSEKIKSDTAMVISAEVYKAKEEIRSELIKASMEQATVNIKNSADSITKKSESGFISDILKSKNQVGL